jgi:isoleucyl-tRNA synthetase
VRAGSLDIGPVLAHGQARWKTAQMSKTQDEAGHAPVLLPRTSYSPRPDPAHDMASASRWLKDGLHLELRSAGRDRPEFRLHDGPPYANGPVHMGHLVNKVSKDMVVRTQRAMGFDATFSPGWDCHGLPVEWKVEEAYAERGVLKRDVPVLEFRAACREYATGWVAVQAAGFRHMGVVADWDRTYLTMSPQADAATVGELQRLLLAGRLHRSLRPVLWSVPEATALADAEVEYREEKCPSLAVRFPLVHTLAQGLEGCSLVCWTTTPWSLPGNRAVAFSPLARYGLYRVLESGHRRLVDGERLVLACERADAFLAEAGCTRWELLHTFDGEVLAGSVCRHPLYSLGYDQPVPVLPADFVETSSGTGLVHVAPTLGPDDFLLGRAHGLDLGEVVVADGAYAASVPAFAGLAVVCADGVRGPADRTLMAALNTAGATVSLRTTRHDAPYSWRSKAPLLYRATQQWFVTVDDALRQSATTALEEVHFLPEGSRTRLQSMLASRPDWCVSRQRPWGVPLGLFMDRATGEPLSDPDVLARTRQAFAEEGGDAWYGRPASFFLGEERKPDAYERCDDVLDVWFESGCTHSWAYGRPEAVADLCLEGTDQHRGWFQSSLLESVATRSRAPYRALMTHGFVLDSTGRKMSKSVGNVVDPEEVAVRHGMDALRLWVATTDTSLDARYSEPAMRNSAETLRRFRNAIRYLLGNLASAPWSPVSVDLMEEPERWVLARMRVVGRTLQGHAEALDFSAMVATLSAFCSTDLSAYWFDARKDSLYCDQADSVRRNGVCTAMAEVFEALVGWLVPMVPFAADEAWCLRHDHDVPSAHLLRWPSYTEQDEDAILLSRQAAARTVRDAVRATCEPLQKAGTLGSLLEADVLVHVPQSMHGHLGAQDLAAVCGTSAVEVKADADAVSVQVEVRSAQGHRCNRCWRRTPDPELCLRCAEVS